MRSAAPALLLALVACETRAPVAARATESASPKAAAENVDRSALHARLRPWLDRHDALPKKLAQLPCPDQALRQSGLSDDERTLAWRVEDARYEKKSLLPLRVTRELVSPSPADLEATLTDARADEAKRAAEAVSWLERRRFVGTFHVVDYAAPKVIHRIDRAKPEWVGGWLSAWLVVHDAKTGAALCATPVHAKIDTSKTSLDKRRRSELTEELTSSLSLALRQAAPGALSKITSELSLEDRRIAALP